MALSESERRSIWIKPGTPAKYSSAIKLGGRPSDAVVFRYGIKDDAVPEHSSKIIGVPIQSTFPSSYEKKTRTLVIVAADSPANKLIIGTVPGFIGHRLNIGNFHGILLIKKYVLLQQPLKTGMVTGLSTVSSGLP